MALMMQLGSILASQNVSDWGSYNWKLSQTLNFTKQYSKGIQSLLSGESRWENKPSFSPPVNYNFHETTHWRIIMNQVW